MAQLLDVMPLVAPHAGALPILNWETHLVRGALLFLMVPGFLLRDCCPCVSWGAHGCAAVAWRASFAVLALGKSPARCTLSW